MHSRVFSLVFSAFLLGAGCADLSRQDPPAQYFRILSLPDIPLKSRQQERVEAVEVVMRGGRFMSINRLPDDWSGEVLPGSDPATLRLHAGRHGTGLRRSSDLQGFVTVLVNAPSSFEIAALVTVCGQDGELSKRMITVKRPDLMVDSLPSPQAQSPSGRALR
jgi:hypothetical protein